MCKQALTVPDSCHAWLSKYRRLFTLRCTYIRISMRVNEGRGGEKLVEPPGNTHLLLNFSTPKTYLQMLAILSMIFKNATKTPLSSDFCSQCGGCIIHLNTSPPSGLLPRRVHTCTLTQHIKQSNLWTTALCTSSKHYIFGIIGAFLVSGLRSERACSYFTIIV